VALVQVQQQVQQVRLLLLGLGIVLQQWGSWRLTQTATSCGQLQVEWSRCAHQPSSSSSHRSSSSSSGSRSLRCGSKCTLTCSSTC
jgi:hypothetical protein